MKQRTGRSSTGGLPSKIVTGVFRSTANARWSTKILITLIGAVASIGIVFGGSTASAQPSATDPTVGVSTVAADELYGLDSVANPSSYGEMVRSDTSPFYAAKYMTWMRFFGVTDLPAPSGEMSMLAQLPGVIVGFFGAVVLSVASAIALAMGLALTVGVSIGLVEKVLFLMDYLFAKVGIALLGLNGEPSAFVTTLVLGVFLSVCGAFLIPRMTGSARAQGKGLKTIAIALVAVVGMGIMSIQATKNHEGSDVDGRISGGNSVTLADSVGREDEAGNSDSWTIGSPGWFVSTAMAMVNSVGGVFSQVTDGVTHSLANTGRSSSGAGCDRYIAGMHAIYQSSGAGKNMAGKSNIVIAYDRLVQQLYYTNYRLATMGSSKGAEHSWCRIAENQTGSPVADQVFIARTAGLYSELIGSGGMGTFTGSSGYDPNAVSMSSISLTGKASSYDVGQSAGVLVTEYGNWKTDRAGEGTSLDASVVASRIFGPNYESGQTGAKADAYSGAQAALLYFSGCTWTGTESGGSPLRVGLNPEWARVYVGSNADNYEGDSSVMGSYGGGNSAVCGLSEWESNSVNSQSNGTFEKQKDPDSTIFNTGFIASEETGNFVSNWNYVDGSSIVSVDVPLFGRLNLGEQESAQTRFADAPAADNLFSKVMGGDTSDVIPLLAVALTLMILMLKFFGPIIAGSIIAQAIAAVVLLISIMAPLFLLIPGSAPKQIASSLAKTFAASVIVSSLIGVIFSLTFGVVYLFTELFTVETSIALVRTVLVGMGAIIGMLVVVKGISMLLKMDITNSKMALTAGIAAGSPVLRQMGWDVITPMDAEYWRKPEQPTKEITTDEDMMKSSDPNSDEVFEGLTTKDDKDKGGVDLQKKGKDDKEKKQRTQPGEGWLSTGNKILGPAAALTGVGTGAAAAAQVAERFQNGYRRTRNGILDAYDSIQEPLKNNSLKAFDRMSDMVYFTATGDHLKDMTQGRQLVRGILPGGDDVDSSDQALTAAGIPLDKMRNQTEDTAREVGAAASDQVVRQTEEQAQEYADALKSGHQDELDRISGRQNSPIERDASIHANLPDNLRGGMYDVTSDLSEQLEREGRFRVFGANLSNMMDVMPDSMREGLDRAVDRMKSQVAETIRDQAVRTLSDRIGLGDFGRDLVNAGSNIFADQSIRDRLSQSYDAHRDTRQADRATSRRAAIDEELRPMRESAARRAADNIRSSESDMRDRYNDILNSRGDRD